MGKFRNFVIQCCNVLDLGLILVVEVVEDNVDRRTNFDIFFHIGEIVEEIGIHFHRNLFVEAHWHEE